MGGEGEVGFWRDLRDAVGDGEPEENAGGGVED